LVRLEIGWLSKSTFGPLETHLKMCEEGLDGFAYRLQCTDPGGEISFYLNLIFNIILFVLLFEFCGFFFKKKSFVCNLIICRFFFKKKK